MTCNFIVRCCRDVLRDEVGDYRHQLKQAADELSKCQLAIDAHAKNEEANKVMHLALLLSCVRL